MELHDVSYGIEYVARPLLLFFSSENRLLWFRYREYDLAHLKLVFEFSIYNVWKSVQYGVSNGLDTAYWGFLGVGTTFDIFQNIHILYLRYGVLSLSGYGVLSFIPLWSLVSAGTDTPYLLDGYGVLFDESNTYVLERFYTSAGNPVKEILLKLNLPDHRILKDGGEDFRYSDTVRPSQSDEVLKLKNIKKDSSLKLFKLTNQERIHLHMGGSYYLIPCLILSTGKDRKTSQRYPDVPTTSWRTLSISTDSRTIDQSTGGKLCDLNPEESWAILEDLALYDNESWNDPRYFVNPFKAIALPQYVPSTFDRRLIKLENQVQRLMEAHLAPTQPTQVNKITTPCDICSGPHNTRHCMENPEQAFVKYASSRTDEAGEDNGEVMFIKIIRDDDEPQNEDPNEEEGATTEEPVVEYFDTFPTRDELTYHRRKLDPRRNTNGGISNFTRRIKRMHVFVGNLTYVIDFMIVEDISSIINPRLSQVILGRPFVDISSMTHDPPEGVVRFVRGADEFAYKMPHKIEQYDSLSDLEKEHTKSVYLRNEEDKRRGVKYVMSEILGFYKECLELGPEYLTVVDDEGEVT
ncbi:hypothetical protein Tco_0919962 [Tanacetum coccineum]